MFSTLNTDDSITRATFKASVVTLSDMASNFIWIFLLLTETMNPSCMCSFRLLSLVFEQFDSFTTKLKINLPSVLENIRLELYFDLAQSSILVICALAPPLTATEHLGLQSLLTSTFYRGNLIAHTCSYPTTLDCFSIMASLMHAKLSTVGRSGKFPKSGFTDGVST